MTDRELLEAAARAAGILGEVEEFYFRLGDKVPRLAVGAENGAWDPLHDDGDALRLAVKLRLEMTWWKNGVRAESPQREPVGIQPFDGDPYAATRRAIVRAAAAIGGAK